MTNGYYAGPRADTSIVSDAGFWNGSRWVSEYPDSMIFLHHDAMRIAEGMSEHFPGCGEVHVVRDYGLASESRTVVKWSD
jgi:hypothetical protein